MARRRLLLAGVAFAATMAVAAISPARANEVDWISGQNTDTATELIAEDRSSESGRDDVEPPTPVVGDDDGGTSINVIDLALGLRPDDCRPEDPRMCAGDPSAPPEEPVAPVVVTLRDIASFRPAAPGNGMEPGGWAIEGLPANFVAAASVQVVSGTLLGQPAAVRPAVADRREPHDGGMLEHGGPGSTWEVLGQREFTGTPTSHVYAVAGEYTVDLSVVLRAEYRFAGSPWRPIAGTLTLAGPPQRVLVGEFDTVLTQGDCNANPSGPGC